jgi:hypothetical protein
MREGTGAVIAALLAELEVGSYRLLRRRKGERENVKLETS